MHLNTHVSIETALVRLVPYEPEHVPTYHAWMEDEELRRLTASERLTLAEEYAMQASWREDADKLTFIITTSRQMIGDINLFLSITDGQSIGELELMIAPVAARGQGRGRAALLAFLIYIARHESVVCSVRLAYLRAKIGHDNHASIKLFESLGFCKTEAIPNFFGEFELRLEGPIASHVDHWQRSLNTYREHVLDCH